MNTNTARTRRPCLAANSSFCLHTPGTCAKHHNDPRPNANGYWGNVFNRDGRLVKVWIPNK